ncbi:hypothetical protein [Thalassotalea litorea]|uniref:hypothetical protein n=1 Tax=Thalassotalea litorea TaxID=2020715 RepID=UPI0037366F67
MNSNLQVGDWVRSYGSGIWKIHRILELSDFNFASMCDEKRTIVFCCRFVNDSFNRSFTTECCDSSLVSHLDVAQTRKLSIFIDDNPELIAKFNAYKPKSIDAVLNARVQIPETNSTDKLEAALSGLESLTAEDVFEKLQKLGIEAKQVPNWTAQFISRGHETADDKLLYNFSKLLCF